jgi:hypothetical protein
MTYFGYKLVAVTTFSGLPVIYELVPAHTDERAAGEAVRPYLRGCQTRRRSGDCTRNLARTSFTLDGLPPAGAHQPHQAHRRRPL